jgi:hypothetical protein
VDEERIQENQAEEIAAIEAEADVAGSVFP